MTLLYKSATSGHHAISITDAGKIVVSIEGCELSKYKRKEALVEIAKQFKLADTYNWSTDKLGLYLILFLNREKTLAEIRNVMSELLPTIEYEENSNESFSYHQQRFMINQIFAKTTGNDYNQSSVMLRLIVIDSLYSTNAQYSYFSIEEMANNIVKLGTEEDATKYFYNLVNGHKDTKHLFSTKYGIRKNLENGCRQMSLMSKYAYYALLQDVNKYPLGFPIYDSLAIAMYPKVCEKLAINKKMFKKQTHNSDLDENNITIEDYVSALNELRKVLFAKEGDTLFECRQQYDILDAYLWRMGKLDVGNYSLLLNKSNYIRFVKNLGLEHYGKYTKGTKRRSAKKLSNENDNTSTPGFNEIVREKTSEQSLGEILKWIKDRECIKVMIEHWQKYYA